MNYFIMFDGDVHIEKDEQGVLSYINHFRNLIPMVDKLIEFVETSNPGDYREFQISHHSYSDHMLFNVNKDK